MKLSNHFTLEELTASETAARLKIENGASPRVIAALTALVTNVLQPLREAYGRPLHVNSGYRCLTLNRAVGGVPSSQHTRGEAADIGCDSPLGLLRTLVEAKIPFDQAILYPTFLHLSFKSAGRNRNNVLYNKSYKGERI